jgi:linoleate 9S-lipoxygenase
MIGVLEALILIFLSQQLHILIVTDPNSEKRLPLLSLDIYVPRDERFGYLKFSDFLAYALKSLVQLLLPELTSLCDKTINEFDTFQDVLKLYEGGIKLPNGHTISKIREHIPCEMFKELARNDGERFLKFPMPDVIKGTPNFSLFQMTLDGLKS